MPFAMVGSRRLFYRLEGNNGLPILALSHSIGADHGMWAPQVPDLLPHFQILRYDIRGHGASDAPAGEYSVEYLGHDVLALADQLRISQFAFCGLSLGGAIGQWLAFHAPGRLTHLVLANTSPQFGPRANWEARIEAVREGGMAAVVDVAMERFFSSKSEAQKNHYAASIRSVLLGTDPLGYAGCCAALRDFDSTQQLHGIKAPTLVIAGDRDISTPWSSHSEILTREIAGAQAIHLPAGHLSNLQHPRSFTVALLEFLLPKIDTPEHLLQTGQDTRRAVLGDLHADRATASTTDFNREFQGLITRYAWGTVWARPAFDPKTRRILALSMIAALGHWPEFRMHVRAGLMHELEPCDLKEVLLQVAIYAGLPAANTGFQIAAEEMAEQKPA